MKFLCPSCKAKYQIADEKVIGRTVKMKCRQCGRLIEINEAVISDTGTSSIVPPRPVEIVSGPETSSGTGAGGKGATPPPKPVRVLTPPAGTIQVAPAGAIQPPPRRTLSQSALQVPKPGLAPVEKVRNSAVPAPRPAPGKGTTTARVVTRPAQPVDAPRPASRVPVDGKVRAAPQLDVAMREDSSPSKPGRSRLANSSVTGDPAIGRLPGVSDAALGALSSVTAKKEPLAGAFNKAVAAPAAAEITDHPLAGDEWYVGVNDQPIGPIRLAEIRDRAAKGEVTAECLVWRDGFEDWKPLTAFPELVAVVEEGLASFRSLRPPAPSSPAAASAPLTASAPVSQTISAPISAPSVSKPVDDELLAVPGLSKPKIPIAAWFAVFMALALGVTIGLVLIKPEPPKQIVKYVEVPVAPKPALNEAQSPASPDNAETDTASSPGNNSVAGEKRNGSAARKGPGNGAAEAPVASAVPDAPQGLKGLQGLQGLGAPRVGPTGEVGASAVGRQQLDSATLSRTVSRYTASVKRSCWQPALDTRAPDASTSARISANIVVAPSGKVQSVTVSPDPKGYRGLSSCIQSRVRNWEFPPAGGSTEFNVPFVFAAQ